jgi:hypothetical protein
VDDHSRLAYQLQWYFDQAAETFRAGARQALQKRGLPRALMRDNGGPTFWASVESRLMAVVDGCADLTLALLHERMNRKDAALRMTC